MKVASTQTVFRALHEAEVRYLVAGGLAVNAHGYLRFTKDLDLVIELGTDNVLRAMEALEGLGYRPAVPVQLRQFADPKRRRGWIEEKGLQVFQVWSDRFPDMPIDLFVREPFVFAEEYGKALQKPLGEIPVRFVRIETLIRMKEATGREQDRIDIEHLKMMLDDDD